MIQDLVLYALAVYGLAWLWTQSTLLKGARTVMTRAVLLFPRIGPLLAEGLSCLVCTGTWIAIGLFFIRADTGIFSPAFAAVPPTGLPVLVGLSIAATWTLGRHNGELADD